MSRFTPEQKTEIVDLFSQKHWSCNMIAKQIGFSRAGIKKFLNLAGWNTSKEIARNMMVECQNCGSQFQLPTSSGRTRKFCSTKCYYEFIKDGEYKPWRQGQRIARAILEPIITNLFGPNQQFISHHKDGNDENNDWYNLMAFPDQSNHLAYHRKQKIACVLIDMSSLLPKR